MLLTQNLILGGLKTKVIILLFLFTAVSFSQWHRLNDKNGWHLLYDLYANNYSVPTFTGFDTSTYSPYSQSYLYFNGNARGSFARHLGPVTIQHMLGLPATKDSFDVSVECNVSLTGRPIMGKLSGSTGWRLGVGLNNGANQIELYIQGIGHTTIDTVASDTAKHLYRFKYNKAQTTLQCWVDGVRTVNNTSATSTAGSHTLSFTIGYEGSNNNISDTTQAPAGSGFKGGFYSLSVTTWTGTADTTAVAVMTGAGENIYFLVTSGGAYVNGLLDFDRADYTDVLNSPHLQLGQSPGRDVRNPIWVNTGTSPTWIDTCAGGVGMFRTSAVVPATDEYVESYTNAECLLDSAWNDSTYVVVGAQFNTCNVTNYRAVGDALTYIGKYNINTKKWSTLNETQKPDNNITSVCQWGDNLIAGGSQTEFTGIARTRGIASFDGTDWSSIDSSFNESVVRVKVIDDTLYASGGFTLSGGTSVVRIAKIASGGEWRGFGTGLSNEAYDFIKYRNELYIIGNFATANGVTVNSLAKWNGTTWVAFGTGLKTSAGGVGLGFSLAVYDGYLYGGGQFDSVAGVACSNLFKYDGTTFTAVGTSITRGSQSSVAVIDMQVDSTHNHLWIVGQFSKFNGKTAYCGVIYNGANFYAMPFQDMRPEGIVIANNNTATPRFFLMGDQMAVYGINVQNIFELTPTFQ